jgi:hypothetical protein
MPEILELDARQWPHTITTLEVRRAREAILGGPAGCNLHRQYRITDQSDPVDNVTATAVRVRSAFKEFLDSIQSENR